MDDANCVHVCDLSRFIYQPQIFAASVLSIVLSTLIILPRTQVDISSTLLTFLHLGSFATHLGSQFWVTFIAGLTMFYSLPRSMFGQAQIRLFPMFFLLSFVTSCVSMTTYILQHPYSSWSRIHSGQGITLTVCIVSSMANCCLFAPKTVGIMIKRGALEKELGVSEKIGRVNINLLCSRSEDYAKVNGVFMIWHCFSSVSNVVTFAANIIYLYQLSSHVKL